jgi:pseudouridine-5'-phosphate glycosidase
MTEMPDYLTISPDVRDALESGRPVVALESTVISHGLPWPENGSLARRLESVVRAGGAVPATIGVLAGRIVVGLDDAGIEQLARPRPVGAAGGAVRKVSRRDLALVQARRQDGATTVATTIWLAERAGIRVMATGGIGGVHRSAGGGQTWDVSADLPELARTQVAVICAGAKAILDLAATREWLETHGVPILGYRTAEFPAFYSLSSGLPVDEVVQAASDAAPILRLHWAMGLGGVLVVVPPPEADALDAREMDGIIAEAIREAEAASVRGKDLTPFLLARVSELSGGRSKAVNLALLENNARVAADLAVELSRA